MHGRRVFEFAYGKAGASHCPAFRGTPKVSGHAGGLWLGARKDHMGFPQLKIWRGVADKG